MRRRRAMSEINVVPYIDVMLVLLVIFMVTAPMLMQGIQVELPKAETLPMKGADSEPMIVSIDAEGLLYLNLGGNDDQSIALEVVRQRVGAVLRRNPEKILLVWGDSAVPYGNVVALMTELQGVGAVSVGLVTETPDRL